MATIDDIGVPGQPMNTPPLTPWQAVVRDMVKALDVTTQATATNGPGVTGTATLYRRGRTVHCVFDTTTTTAAAPGGVMFTIPTGFRPTTTWQIVAYNFTTQGNLLLNGNAGGTVVVAQIATVAGHRFIGSQSWPVAVGTTRPGPEETTPHHQPAGGVTVDTLSSVPQTKNLAAYAGDTFTVAVQAQTVFIAGRVFTAQIRQSATATYVLVDFTVTPPTVADGPAYLTLTAAQTQDLFDQSPGKFTGVWDVQLAPANGGDPTVTLVRGQFTVTGDVTRHA